MSWACLACSAATVAVTTAGWVSIVFLEILKALTTSFSSYIFHSSRFYPFLELAATKNAKNSPGSIPAYRISTLRNCCFAWVSSMLQDCIIAYER